MQRSGAGKNRVELRWQDSILGFSDVSGLSTEVEYQQITSAPSLTEAKSAVKRKQLLLHRGQSMQHQAHAWINQLKQMRGTVSDGLTLTLFDQAGQPLASWLLAGCELGTLRQLPMKSDANEVAIESLQLFYEHIQRLP